MQCLCTSQLEQLTMAWRTVLENIVPGILSQPALDDCRWFQSLSDESRKRLTLGSEIWKDLPRQRLQKDGGAIVLEVDNLHRSFGMEKNLCRIF